jgi:hypothetical protein
VRLSRLRLLNPGALVRSLAITFSSPRRISFCTCSVTRSTCLGEVGADVYHDETEGRFHRGRVLTVRVRGFFTRHLETAYERVTRRNIETVSIVSATFRM